MHNGGKEYGADFMLADDSPPSARSRAVMGSALYRQDWENYVKTFYDGITLSLLRDKSYKISGSNQVDIVRDVGNIAQVHFAAEVCHYSNGDILIYLQFTDIFSGFLLATENRQNSVRHIHGKSALQPHGPRVHLHFPRRRPCEEFPTSASSPKPDATAGPNHGNSGRTRGVSRWPRYL